MHHWSIDNVKRSFNKNPQTHLTSAQPPLNNTHPFPYEKPQNQEYHSYRFGPNSYGHTLPSDRHVNRLPKGSHPASASAYNDNLASILDTFTFRNNSEGVRPAYLMKRSYQRTLFDSSINTAPGNVNYGLSVRNCTETYSSFQALNADVPQQSNFYIDHRRSPLCTWSLMPAIVYSENNAFKNAQPFP